jgi:Phage late-transcription coactivator
MSKENMEKVQDLGLSTITTEDFSFEIERRVWSDKNDDSYISHTSKYLEELDLDAEDGKKLISPSLMDKIKNEALQLKLLKERNTTSSVVQF